MSEKTQKKLLNTWSRRKENRSRVFAPVLVFLLISGLTLSACGPKVTRISPEEAVDLSGRWNDTDSRMVAEEMVKEALGRPWVENYTDQHKKSPTVIVGTVVNRSHEHINVQTFIKDLERELTNSGQVQFVAAKGEREEVREERLDQAQNATEETAKSPGKEVGADYMLKGTLNTIVDESGKVKAVFYQVDLEMIDLESNVKVWFGQKKIKKVISRKLLGY